MSQADYLPDFNPRSPCGERRWDMGLTEITWIFQSTLPVWGATLVDAVRVANAADFNPRSPCGERPPRLAKTGL